MIPALVTCTCYITLLSMYEPNYSSSTYTVCTTVIVCTSKLSIV